MSTEAAETTTDPIRPRRRGARGLAPGATITLLLVGEREASKPMRSTEVGTRELRSLLLAGLVEEFDRRDPDNPKQRLWVRLTEAGKLAEQKLKNESQEFHVEPNADRALRQDLAIESYTEARRDLEAELKIMTARCERLREAYLALAALKALKVNEPHAPAIGRYVQAKEALRRGDLGERK